MIVDLFRLAVTNLVHRSLRSGLTIIGIFIGIAAVVSLISVGQGLQDSISEQFESLGANVLTISPGAGLLSGPPGSSLSAAKLTDDDVRVIESVRGVETAAGFQFKLGKVRFRDELKYTYVLGMPSGKVAEDLMESQGIELLEGRELKEGDRYSAVVGYSFGRDNFFEKNLKIRDRLEIEGQEFKIIGVYDSVGNPSDDSQVYIPLDTFREVFNESDSFALVYVQVQEGFDPEDVAEDVKKALRKSRGVKEGEEDFTISTPQQLAEVFASVFGVVQGFLIGIAAISLLVGGVGIMNSMYTSVLERTKDIGIMKAIGARNEHILILFLFESGLLGVVGGLFGIAFGVILAKAVEFFAASAGYGFLTASVTPELIFGALMFSFVVGAISGALPARRASQMNPVDALRHE
ncbi:MAG: ABC transporter permease [Candidatus Aenigmarchaeota archaeon]|nr:ABC transporter permease [Candidatus Aenigmarchaeota archaeon]